MKLEELEVCQAAMEMAEQVWGLVAKWEYFATDTVGKQLVRAADSAGKKSAVARLLRCSTAGRPLRSAGAVHKIATQGVSFATLGFSQPITDHCHLTNDQFPQCPMTN